MRLACLVVLASMFLVSCSPLHPPLVKEGMVDFSQKDFDEQPLAALDGLWQFVPGRLVAANEDDWELGSTAIAKVPGLWCDQVFLGEPGPRFGVGTYRLHLRLPSNPPALKLYLTNLQSASVIFFDGVRVGGRGVVSEEPRAHRAEDLPYTVELPRGRTEVDLVIQVANWHNSQGGGVLSQLRLGTSEAVDQYLAGQMLSEVLVGGLFVFMALFTLILFVLQRRDRSLFVFAAVALSFAARQTSPGATLGFFAADLPFDFILRWQEGSSFLACGFLALYFQLVFPRSGKRFFSHLLAATGLGLGALVWLTPTEVFSATLPLTQALVYLTILNAVVVVTHAWVQREPLAPAFLAVVLFLSLPAATEALLADLALPQLTTLGFLPFLLFQSYLLARRFTLNAVEAENLRVTNSQLKELDLAKTNFLANISHELRTPLSLIQAPVDALMEGEYGKSIPHTHPVFTVVKNNCARLLTLVERLLHLTRLESGQSFNLRTVDYPRLVKSYFSEFESLATQANIALEFEQIPVAGRPRWVVRLDPQGFETVFFNFLSNALKFTPTGGRITVRLGLSSQGLARLEVQDTGPGIDPLVLQDLFVSYRKIYDHQRHHYDGHGIGLALAHQTALALGGCVGVESQLGQGSRFWLDLPFSDQEPQDEPSPGPLPPYLKIPASAPSLGGTASLASTKNRILVVEDNEDLRNFIAHALSEYEVITARHGGEAAELLAQAPLPDLILSDMMMPVMGGMELFEYTRLRPSLTSVPFLFLTARSEPKEQEALLHQGLAAYLLKPFSVGDLRARIASILALRGNERLALENRLLSVLREGPQAPGKVSYPSDATPREVEVLKALVAGKTDKEIGALLGISTRTASNHVAALLRKTGLRSRQALGQRYAER